MSRKYSLCTIVCLIWSSIEDGSPSESQIDSRQRLNMCPLAIRTKQCAGQVTKQQLLMLFFTCFTDLKVH